MKKPTSKQRKERAALDVLRGDHSYILAEPSLKRERESMIWQRDRATGKSVVLPAVAIRLIVPADSHLGQEIIANRKARPK